MKPVSVNQLAAAIKGQIIHSYDVQNITGVSIDSRTIQPGHVFFAIQGEQFDGHDYVSKAIENGASCIIVERETKRGQTSLIQVDDTIEALGRLAAWYRKQLSANVIAVTGSVGKTTTRNILYQILSRFFTCRQAPKSFNNHIGVPLTILSAEQEDAVLLLELGSNHPGEIEYLTAIAKPDIALVTYITHAHLDGFGSIENIIREKSSIAMGLSPTGTLIINGDQPELAAHVRATYDVNTITVGLDPTCDIIGTDVTSNGPQGSLVIEGRTVHVPLAGMAGLLNVLSAWAVCREFISLADFIEAVESLQPYEQRLVPVTIGPVMVLDDCYNANPASMKNALCCLHAIANETGRRAVFIAGHMAELGYQSASLHEQLGRDAAGQKVQLLLAAGAFADPIVQSAHDAAKAPMESCAFENTDQLCDNLHKWLQPDDIILIKGSRSAHLERAVERVKQLFGN